jgi:hypothetical protein
MKVATVKDARGERRSITLYNQFRNQVTAGGVYCFHNLSVSTYKGNDIVFRLQTTSQSRIQIANAELAEMFHNVPLGDGLKTGTIVGFNEPYLYKSCPHCKSKVEEDPEICNKCLKAISQEDLVNDFNTVLHLQEGEDYHGLFTFRNHLKTEIKTLMLTEVEDILNEHWLNKKVKVDYLLSDDDQLKTCSIELAT